HPSAGGVRSGWLAIDEQHVLAQAPRRCRATGDADARALRLEPEHLERVALHVGAAVPAGAQAEAAELGRDIRRHLVELGTGRRAAEHRVVRDDADAAPYVVQSPARR